MYVSLAGTRDARKKETVSMLSISAVSHHLSVNQRALAHTECGCSKLRNLAPSPEADIELTDEASETSKKTI